MAEKKFLPYDWFKLIVAIILLLLLLSFWGQPGQPTGDTGNDGTDEPIQEVTQIPPPVGEPTLTSPDSAGATVGPIAFAGTADPGANVQVVLDGEVIGTTTADDEGNWSLDYDVIDPGTHTAQVDVLDEAGDVAASSPQIEIDFAAVVVDTGGEDDSSDTDTGDDDTADDGDDSNSDDGSDDNSDDDTADDSGNDADADDDDTGDDGSDAGADDEDAGSKIACGPGPVYGTLKGNIYTVNYCDTLHRIAQYFGVTLDAILKANPDIKNPDIILPGQQIVIPK